MWLGADAALLSSKAMHARAVALIAVFVAALLALTGAALWHLRESAIDAQRHELSLMSLALTDEIARSLEGAREGLKAVQTELQQNRIPFTGAQAPESLQTRADLMPMVDTLWLVDAAHRQLSASNISTPPASNSFSPPLSQLRASEIAISAPFVSGAAHEMKVAVAMRIGGHTPQADGWIIAGLPANDLLGAFAVAAPSTDAQIGIIRADGVALAGSITREPIASGELVAMRVVPHLGVKVVLTRDLGAVLEAWRQTAVLSATTIGLLAIVLAGAASVVRRADKHRDDARRALESQLARASKLEALGTLAGGVAHDFNNVLGAIMGFGEMAHDASVPGSAQRRHIDRVLQAASRGQTLIERILAFSKAGARASAVFDLEPIVEEVLAMLASSLRPGLVLERAFDSDGARVRGDPAQAFEVVMNLCTNAMQAMPGSGRLTVGIQKVALPQAKVFSHSRARAGRYVALIVRDEGTGMTPEVLEHLFEPFFTTRAGQSGTGLGLAVVHGVMLEFGGAIDVRSQPEQGASFTLYFPECLDAADPEIAPADAVPQGQGQALLVVDDEPELLAMMLELVAGLGYRPVGLSDAAAALAALRAPHSAFACLITDEVMPGLTGTALTREIRKVLPDLPVLLLTGYGGALLASRAAEAGVSRVLNKPIRRAELAQALAAALA